MAGDANAAAGDGSDAGAPSDGPGFSAPPPTGRLSRLWKLSSLSSGVLASRALGAVKKSLAGKDEKEAAASETNLATAIRIADTFGEMKGAVMKLGQVLSIQEDAVPPEFRDVLSKLQSQAPPMHPSYAIDAIQRELGRKLTDLYDDFERKPLASASLGQVHAARLKGTGEPVVVKVQYPGIEKTIASDLKLVGPVVKAIALTGRSYDMREMLEEVEARLHEELDYEREASNQETLFAALAPLASVRVPRVIRTHSSRRVITMERLHGIHLDAFIATAPSQGERDRRAVVLSDLFWTMQTTLGILHADPHPGNFLFLEDGRVGLLDFGCMKRFDDAFIRGYVRLLRRIFARDDDGVMDMYERIGFMSAAVRTPERVKAWLEWSYISCRPLIEDRAWPDPARGESWSVMIKDMHEALAQFMRKVGTYTPRDAVFLNRVSLGMMCFWTRLDTSLNWHRIVTRHLALAEARLGDGPVRSERAGLA